MVHGVGGGASGFGFRVPSSRASGGGRRRSGCSEAGVVVPPNATLDKRRRSTISIGHVDVCPAYKSRVGVRKERNKLRLKLRARAPNRLDAAPNRFAARPDSTPCRTGPTGSNQHHAPRTAAAPPPPRKRHTRSGRPDSWSEDGSEGVVSWRCQSIQEIGAAEARTQCLQTQRPSTLPPPPSPDRATRRAARTIALPPPHPHLRKARRSSRTASQPLPRPHRRTVARCRHGLWRGVVRRPPHPRHAG